MCNSVWKGLEIIMMVQALATITTVFSLLMDQWKDTHLKKLFPKYALFIWFDCTQNVLQATHRASQITQCLKVLSLTTTAFQVLSALPCFWFIN